MGYDRPPREIVIEAIRPDGHPPLPPGKLPSFGPMEPINLTLTLHNETEDGFFVDKRRVLQSRCYHLVKWPSMEPVRSLIRIKIHMASPTRNELTIVPPGGFLALAVSLRKDIFPIYASLNPNDAILFDPGEYRLVFTMDIHNYRDYDEPDFRLGTVVSQPFHFVITEPEPALLDTFRTVIMDPDAYATRRTQAFKRAVRLFRSEAEPLIVFFEESGDPEWNQLARQGRLYIQTMNARQDGTAPDPPRNIGGHPGSEAEDGEQFMRLVSALARGGSDEMRTRIAKECKRTKSTLEFILKPFLRF